mgnify:CR=1 FL=1
MNYTGGKYKLLKQILPIFPDKIDGDFIDLFCGGGDVCVNTTAKRIIANDMLLGLIQLKIVMFSVTGFKNKLRKEGSCFQKRLWE